MSHIYGHVDDTNTNPPDFANYRMMITADASSVGDRLPFGILTIGIGKDGKVRQLPFKNVDLIPLGQGQPIGYHIYLTNLDLDKYDKKKPKFRAYASDIIPWADHEQAENLAQEILGKKYGAKHLEAYDVAQIREAAEDDRVNAKGNLKKVLLQTASYMETPSFKMLYLDDDDDQTLLTESKRDDRILKKVIFKIKEK